MVGLLGMERPRPLWSPSPESMNLEFLSCQPLFPHRMMVFHIARTCHGSRHRQEVGAMSAVALPEPDGVRIGAQLKAARLARRKTLAEVAEAADLTKGFLSKIERDQASASVAS